MSQGQEFGPEVEGSDYLVSSGHTVDDLVRHGRAPAEFVGVGNREVMDAHVYHEIMGQIHAAPRRAPGDPAAESADEVASQLARRQRMRRLLRAHRRQRS